MSMYYGLVVAMGALAVLYGLVASRQVLSASAGNARMQELAARAFVAAGCDGYARIDFMIPRDERGVDRDQSHDGSLVPF